MDGVLQRLQRQQAAPARALGRVASPAFAPSAIITDVSPIEFRPGDNIDVSVAVHASNPEGWWNTCIVITRQDTGAIYRKTHGMPSASDDFVEPLVCGVMPDESVQLLVEVWGHPDFYSKPPA